MQEPLETVQKLLDIMEQNQLVELTVEWDEYSIHLERESAPQEGGATAATSVADQSGVVVIPGTPIEAPMTGMFYRGPSPNDPPYVQEGDAVQEGQTIGLIEAMKVFNELPAPFSGIVRKIVAHNATLVQAGEVLMYIEAVGSGQ